MIEALAPKSKTILIVEDEFLLLEETINILAELGYTEYLSAMNYEEARKHLMKAPDLVLLDIQIGNTNDGLLLAKEITHRGKTPFVFLSSHSEKHVLNKAKSLKPYGYLVKPIHKETLNATLEMAFYRAAYEKANKGVQLKELLISISDALAGGGDRTARYLNVSKLFQKSIPFDLICFCSSRIEEELFMYERIGKDEYRFLSPKYLAEISKIDEEEIKTSFVDNQGYFGTVDDQINLNEEKSTDLTKILNALGVKSHLILSMVFEDDQPHWIIFYHKKPEIYTAEHVERIEKIKDSISIHFEKQWAFQKIKELSELLQNEKNYLREEIKVNHNFDEIVGTSTSLKDVLNNVGKVAKTDSTVLVLGESGTGKELIARAIHASSKRSKSSLIKLNCATLPHQLLESELFGHEKGSFTGALKRRIGKFELANNGTIFLDEIGELPFDLQAKLLRVLQEKEFERLGGNETLKLNVRIIAATNRNLLDLVRQSKFREDLYFRLHVFPIKLPPLRERKNDIPKLARHFFVQSCKKIGKSVKRISDLSMERLMRYHWPGNIRELQNTIERAVILSDSEELMISINELNPDSIALASTAKAFSNPDLKTYKDFEKAFIIEALEKCNGKIRGTGGAAQLLDLNPSTLDSRIRKLGIKKKQNYL